MLSLIVSILGIVLELAGAAFFIWFCSYLGKLQGEVQGLRQLVEVYETIHPIKSQEEKSNV